MAEAPFGNPAVPLSHRLGAGTMGQSPPDRDNAGTPAGTDDLKALARRVLARDTRRDNNGTRCPTERPPASMTAGIPKADPAVATTWGEAEEERAAIVEHDGKIPHAWAEGFAQLDPDRPPGDVPTRRWRRFIDDIGRFLDDDWAEKAVALGWGPHDLFGCDRDRPFARIDQAGLLWLLNGNKLVMLAENAATIETRTGARQTWRRKPDEPGRALAWELAGGDHQ